MSRATNGLAEASEVPGDLGNRAEFRICAWHKITGWRRL